MLKRNSSRAIALFPVACIGNVLSYSPLRVDCRILRAEGRWLSGVVRSKDRPGDSSAVFRTRTEFRPPDPLTRRAVLACQ